MSCLGGALFYPWKGLVAGLKRAVHRGALHIGGCMMHPPKPMYSTFSSAPIRLAARSTSPLPATLSPLPIYIYSPPESLSIPRPSTPPTDWHHTASSRPSLPSGCLFVNDKATQSHDENAPPKTYVLYFLFLPPVGVATMSTSPPERMLCPMSANHFICNINFTAFSYAFSTLP